jgi:beta-xylosidase
MMWARRFLVGGLTIVVIVGTAAVIWVASRSSDEAQGETRRGNKSPSTTTTTTTVPPAPADPAAPAVIITSLTEDAPNPWILVEGGKYYLYSSRSNAPIAPEVPVRVSTDLVNWSVPTDALPVGPPWVSPHLTWAPDVRRIKGQYVMYFTAPVTDVPVDTKCIGVATSLTPEGPFTPRDGAFICQFDRAGSIDPRVFEDTDGTLWMHWKSDENANQEVDTHSWIWAQRLSENGLKLVGEPVPILTADQEWEGRIVEAPQMVLEDGRYWLFYSGNWYNQPVYSIGIAECAGPVGPCTKPINNPFITSNAQGEGTGESSLFRDENGLWIVYAPWAVDYEEPTPRPVALAHVAFNESGPYLAQFVL